MSTTIRIAVISTLALFALLITGPSTRADSFDITGHTNTVVCSEVAETCPEINFNLVAKVEPWRPDIFQNSLFLITSLSGEINGQSITAPSPDGLLEDHGSGCCGFGNKGPIPFAPGIPDYLLPPSDPDMRFFLNGQEGFFGFDDMITGSMYVSGPVEGAITWNAVPVVATPEPSSLLLLWAGIIALGALTTAKRFL